MPLRLGLGLGPVLGGRVGPPQPTVLFTSAGSFPENIASGAALGTLSCINATGTPAYTLTNNDGTRVAISGANITRGATAWDYETHPLVSFTISVAGMTPAVPPRTFDIVVTNVLETILAALGLSPATVSENVAIGTVVGAITGKTSGSTLSLFDNAGGLLALSGTNIVTAADIDREVTGPSLSITIRETHPDAAPRDTTLPITVTDVLEITLAPLTLNPHAIVEGSAAGTMVGSILGQTSGSTLELFDDAGDRFAFGAAGDPALKLDLDFTTGTLDSKVTFTRSTTATYVNASGVVTAAAINTPRFDHNPATLAARGLLLEEQRTNICTGSGALGNGSWWNLYQSTVTLNNATAPDGTTTATLLTAAGSKAIVYQAADFADGTTYTQSIYAKKGTADWLFITMQTAGEPNAYFNLATGTVGSFDAPIISTAIQDMGNGWYRCSATRVSSPGSSEFATFGLSDANSSNVATIGRTISVWGAQMEAGAFVTSYMPTTTVAVTRAADVAVMTGTNFSSWWNASAGTFVAGFSGPASGTRPIVSADDNTANEVIMLYGSGTDPKAIVTDGGATQADLDAGAIVANTAAKLGLSFAANDFAACLNGGTVATDTGGTLPTVTQGRLGAGPAANYLTGRLASLRFYNVAKTDVELQALTAP